MGKMDWHRFFKRYVWDDDKTPYLVAADRLTKKQAGNELFIYACFVSMLFIILGLIFCSAKAPLGQSYGGAFYCFSVSASAVMLYASKDIYPAIYCALAPLAIALFVLLSGRPANLHNIDIFVLLVACALWFYYSFRVIAIAKHYPQMVDQRADD